MARLFTSASDAEVVKGLNSELYETHAPRMMFYSLDLEETQTHTLYNDDASETGRVYADPVEVAVFWEFQPTEKTLDKYGLDKNRELMLHFSRPWLEDNAIVEPKIGDRVKFRADFFDILDINESGHFPNLDIYLQIVVAADKDRPGSQGERT